MLASDILTYICFKISRHGYSEDDNDGRTRGTATTSPSTHLRLTRRDRLPLPGSLVWRTTACGKTGCHCQADPPVLHGPYLTWTRTVNGKTVTRKISEDQQDRYQAWFDNARKLRRLVTDLEALSLRAFEQAEGSSKP